MPEQESKNNTKPVCFACGKVVPKPGEKNHIDEEIICDSCREEMISSLEGAWAKHSAFLDSALN